MSRREKHLLGLQALDWALNRTRDAQENGEEDVFMRLSRRWCGG